MKNVSFRQALPYLAAIAIFIVIALAYFSPLLEGKVLKQSDITQFKGMSKEIVDYRAQTGEEALWTNSMFGGMPAYQISVEYKGNLLRYADQFMMLYLPHPAGLVFLYMIGFFILLLVLKVDKWLAIAGALAFAFSSYLFIIFEAGHNSKAHAIGYMAPVLAGIILTYRGKYLYGGIMAAIFLSLEILANHFQITYYLMLAAGIYVITELVSSIREKTLPGFAKATGVLAIAAIFALATNITNLWATYEYSKETIRGKTELTSEKSNRTSGLDKDYATGWSYGKMETFTFLIPDFNGGASQGQLKENSNTYKALINNNIDDAQAKSVIKSLPLYWGTQPGVAGPVYIGAIIMFLFVFALFTVDNKYKWWLLAATLLSIMLAWGKNLMPLTDFFMHFVPGYNKFRAVSMTLVIAELCIPLLAVLGLQKAFENNTDKKKIIKSLYYSTGIAAGICLIFAFTGNALFNFVSPSDVQYKSYFPEWLMDAIRLDRASLLSSDAFRSLAFILLAATALWALLNKKLKQPVFYGILILLVLIDMWSVDRRYVNDESFVRKSIAAVPFQPSTVDQIIMKDKDPNYRVLNQSVGNPFADASTSYFHKSLGGYHGAKLRRYQELIDQHLLKGNMNVYNMLNTKYFILAGEKGGPPQMQINMQALGNAWFVNNAHAVNTADEEINALTDFVPAETAIYDKRFQDQVKGHMISKDTLATIALTVYSPNHLTYQSNAEKEQLAVFSEIYYDKGWNAYIDGKKSPYFRANYVLRAMIVPAGKHTIEYKFEPVVYKTGEKISLASSVLLILLSLGGLGFKATRKSKTDQTA
ncbi:MAG: YfhO family protein [Bacteroidota bacterium]